MLPYQLERTLPQYGILFVHPVLLEKHVQSMQTMIVLYDSTRTAQLATDRNLHRLHPYLELILVVVLEHKRSRSQLIDQVQLVVLHFLHHFEQEGRGFVAPRDCSGHFLITIIKSCEPA